LKQRKFLGLKITDVLHLAYNLAVREGIKKTIFAREMKTMEGSG
jgi:hypothetical protein